MINKYFESDVIRRTFKKPRGDIILDYEYTARAETLVAREGERNYWDLLIYMCKVFHNGATYKEKGCSNCNPLLGVEFTDRKSPVVDICRESKYRGLGTRQHPKVQEHFLETDKYTLCYELPVYSDKHNRSGFIDLIRYDPSADTIWILDFKPRAHKEDHEKVLSQLQWYKIMLNEVTSIPLDKIKCAYFDDINYYELI